MSMIVSSPDVDSLAMQSYSRKEKSLGVLVANFLRLYNRDDADLIGLDDAAGKLGVERRRIYDVVNILESIGVVARKGKNQYSWKGFGEVPKTLNELKEEGMKERFGVLNINNSDKEEGMKERFSMSNIKNSDKVAKDVEREEAFSLTPDELENSSSSRMDNKKEKSLWLLSQNFVKMFLCSEEKLITLDSAAKSLLNDSQDPMNMRTKVRRLYDIANVFSSMNLIEKTQIPETRKPAYKWLGSKSLTENGSILFNSSEPKKRVFGTELTNIRMKRNKTDCSSNTEQIGFKKYDEENTEPETKPAASSYVFGPFSPIGASSEKKTNKSGNRLQDLEALASTFRPQYCNPELTGLLGHYAGAMKLWYSELDRK